MQHLRSTPRARLPRCRLFLATISLLCLIGFCQSVRAQSQPLVFEHYTNQQGLSQSIVTSILQDSRGFLWFGTEDGLNIYDGYDFLVLRYDPDDEHSLSYNQVNTIYEDRSGAIWVGTFNGGVNRYILKKNRFIRYRNSPKDSTSLSYDIVNCIVQDRNGNLWVGTEFGLNRMKPGPEGMAHKFERFFSDPRNPGSLVANAVRTLCLDSTGQLWIGTPAGVNCLPADQLNSPSPKFKRYVHDPRSPNSLSHNLVRSMYVDRSGAVWVGTEQGLNKRQGESFRRYVNEPSNPRSLNNNAVYAILEDRRGVLWVGTNGGGVNRFDQKSGTFFHYLNDLRDPTSLGYNEIRSLFQDRSGLLWVGTYGSGVDKVDPNPKEFRVYRPDPNNPNSLNQAIVWSIYEDPQGILWIGTHGGGLNRFDRRNNRFKHYRAAAGDPGSLSNDYVRLVIPDRRGKLWIGTNGGGLCLFDPRTERFRRFQNDPGDPASLSNDAIRALWLDSNEVLWIGTNGGGMNTLNTRTLGAGKPRFTRYFPDAGHPNRLNNLFPRDFHEDRNGIVWIGTLGGGLNRFDRKTGTFSALRSNPRDRNSLNNDFIFCVHETKDGILWLGTWGGGINRYDPKTGMVKHFTHKEGLPSDAIYSIMEDGQGYLWCSTNNGLVRFDPRTGQCRNFTVRDGLQSNEFNGGSYSQSPSGEMFFGGINGFNAFFPDRIRDNMSIPPIVLTSFRKLNKEVRFDRPLSEVKEITLSYMDYVFSFEFAALDFNVPEQNQYAYKMEGLDEDWIVTSSRKRFAQYTTLNPGKYVFRVKGSNNDGVWNEEGLAVTVVITPPFYATWWFRLLVIAIFLLAFGLLYRRRLRIVRLKAELQAAHRAQMSIMPQQDPSVRGFDISGSCIPANEVGGDFYDYIRPEHDADRFGIVVGDVAGKAMNAAMTAVLASGIINAEARNGNSVAQILGKANRLLYPKMNRQIFTAICLLSIDLKRKRLAFTNAGLVKPLLKSAHTVKELASPGSTHALGMVADTTYREKIVTLKGGDVLIIQTDGLVEAQNPARELYGEERLVRMLRNLDAERLTAHEIKEALFADVRKFIGAAHQFDDMTIVVVKAL